MNERSSPSSWPRPPTLQNALGSSLGISLQASITVILGMHHSTMLPRIISRCPTVLSVWGGQQVRVNADSYE